MPYEPSWDRYRTRIGRMPRTALPPKLAQGSREPWKMKGSEYARALRTYYVQVDRETALTVQKRILEGRRPSARDALRWLDTPYGMVFTFPSIGWLQARTYPIYPHELEPYIEVEIPPESSVLDWRESLSFFDIFLPEAEPPLYGDFLNWLTEATKGQFWSDDMIRGMRSFDKKALDHPHGMVSLARFYARDRGYAALLVNTSEVHLIDPSVVTVVDSYPDGVRTIGHSEIVDQALVERPNEVPEEVAWCTTGISELASLRWGAMPKDISEPLAGLEDSLSTLLRIMGDLRQQQRTLRQDLELDYLGILTIRKMYYQLAAINFGLGMQTGCKHIEIARHFPLPGPSVAGLIRRPGQEDWPDHLVELSLNPATVQRSDSLEKIKELIGLLVEANRYAKIEIETHMAATALGSGYLKRFLADVRWPKGRDIIDVLLVKYIQRNQSM